MHQIQALGSFSILRPVLNTFFKTIAGSLFIALSAQISIPLPFSVVPLSCQTLAILFLGVTLGSKQAAACTMLYLLEGMSGLPVFAGGLANPLAFFGPRAGYLFAMPIIAFLAGQASAQKSVLYNLIVLASASVFLLLAGTAILSLFVGLSSAFLMGFYPFLAGDALKVLLVTFYLFRKNKC